MTTPQAPVDEQRTLILTGARIAALTFMLSVTTTQPAHAQLYDTGATCSTHFNATGILTGKYRDAGSMLSVCVLKNGKIYSATAFSAPRKNALGICSVTAEDVTIRRRKDGTLFEPKNDPLPAEGYTVTTYMAVPAGPTCPKQDDDSYLNARGVPDGVFLALFDTWKAIQKDPSSFSTILSIDNPDRAAPDSFKKAVEDPTVMARLVLTGIVAEKMGDFEPSTPRSTIFKLVIHDTADWYEWYEVGMDWTPQGWRVVTVELPAI